LIKDKKSGGILMFKEKHYQPKRLYFSNRLTETMGSIIDHPLTVVEAPMGYRVKLLLDSLVFFQLGKGRGANRGGGKGLLGVKNQPLSFSPRSGSMFSSYISIKRKR
jgi:hypothetical protein